MIYRSRTLSSSPRAFISVPIPGSNLSATFAPGRGQRIELSEVQFAMLNAELDRRVLATEVAGSVSQRTHGRGQPLRDVVAVAPE